MRGRSLMWWTAGLGFAVTLAVVVGQRLSAEAMAVVIGVIAGVAASIPTSLIVVWFASRANMTHTVVDLTPRRAPEPEPRIVVVTQPPQPPPAYPGYGAAGMAPAGQTAGYASAAYAPQAILPPRRFTVVGGTELAAEAEAEAVEEVTWER
ncbi:MAG: hypothetical protein IT318_21485 [Anaerolineales bacterium]|nr:hypothetical protein [Anaerolineales bacterium]